MARARPDALESAAATARTSAEATKGMLAQRGRASYTGDRSRDSVDAGAMGVAVMFEAVSKAWRGRADPPDRSRPRGAGNQQRGEEVKKFVNDPQQFVPEMLKGIELANPGKLKYVPEYNLIMRRTRRATTRCRSSRARARAMSRRT